MSTKGLRKKQRKEKIEFLVIGIIFTFGVYLAAPRVAGAVLDLGPRVLSGAELSSEIAFMKNETRAFGRLPQAQDGHPTRILELPVTAYSSDSWQTDSTPTITASGTTVRPGVVAANFVPIGTRVRLPELYGDQVFIVEDRMNGRFHKRVDVWMEETADARNFGLQWTTVEVF